MCSVTRLSAGAWVKSNKILAYYDIRNSREQAMLTTLTAPPQPKPSGHLALPVLRKVDKTRRLDLHFVDSILHKKLVLLVQDRELFFLRGKLSHLKPGVVATRGESMEVVRMRTRTVPCNGSVGFSQPTRQSKLPTKRRIVEGHE